MKTSQINKFKSLSPSKRNQKVCEAADLDARHGKNLSDQIALPIETADAMIENVIGSFELPLGVATNFQINNRDYLIPMAVEEPSVVAAASYMAKLVRNDGGFTTSSTAPVMRGQLQILGLKDLEQARSSLLKHKDSLIAKANDQDKMLCSIGGGCLDIEVHLFADTAIGPMAVLHLLVDVRDAMGANAVNTMAEHITKDVEKITNGEVRLRILSNLADKRLASASLRVSPTTLTTESYSGERVVQGIVEAAAFAAVDPYRAATHNKGIMNGIDPVVLATGNDWRAIEAGAHAYASRSGRYTALTDWRTDSDGWLCGKIELPMALGIVGGATRTHPAAAAALEMMNIGSASELAEVVVAVGLAQNMAALRALSTEGIQRGHMALHARNIAINAGAVGDQVELIAEQLIQENVVSVDRAKELLCKE